MGDTMRWRYADTNPVVAAVDRETVIETGDLLWQDISHAKPASMVDDMAYSRGLGESVIARPEELQQFFAKNFLGVAMQRSRSGDTEPIRVATTGVFEFDCDAGAYQLGDLFGAIQRGSVGLLNQVLGPVASSSHAIGRVAVLSNSDRQNSYIAIRSSVMTGGI